MTPTEKAEEIVIKWSENPPKRNLVTLIAAGIEEKEQEHQEARTEIVRLNAQLSSAYALKDSLKAERDEAFTIIEMALNARFGDLSWKRVAKAFIAETKGGNQ